MTRLTEGDKMLTAADQRSARAYIDHALNVYTFLPEQCDLSPRNPKVNATLYAFVRDTMKERSAKEVAVILNTPRIQQIAPGLRRLLAQAEYEMEYLCASAMVVGREAGVEERFSSYRNFIYRDNYEALIAAERHAMERYAETPRIGMDRKSIAFVGAGPLPMSAIMFHQQTGLRVTCIDKDEKACQCGQRLVNYLTSNRTDHKDLDKAIHFVHESGKEYDYGTHQIVFIASLVEEKESIITRIANTARTTTTAIVRSAHGLSTLLYRPEDCIASRDKYAVYLVGKTPPSPEAINTSLVYRIPPAIGRNYGQKSYL
jgi:hypothetical protein